VEAQLLTQHDELHGSVAVVAREDVGKVDKEGEHDTED
jgi:hypothetical protein